jgi:hypothetical protein
MILDFLKRVPRKYENLPRYWPALFVAGHSGEFLTHFHLQKTIYLLKVECRVPISYKFAKDTHGPYDVEIKSDAHDLSEKGLLAMQWEGRGWKFHLTAVGADELLLVEKVIGSSEVQKLKRTVQKYCYLPIAKLEEYVYKNHVCSKGQHATAKSDLLRRADSLLRAYEEYPTSRNQLVVSGAIDFCKVALEHEHLTDVVHQDQIRRATEAVLAEATALLDLNKADREALQHFSLDGFEETFHYCRQIAQDLGVLPDLFSEDSDWTVLSETSPVASGHVAR